MRHKSLVSFLAVGYCSGMVATVGLLGECWLQLVGCGGIDLDSPSGEYPGTTMTAKPL